MDARGKTVNYCKTCGKSWLEGTNDLKPQQEGWWNVGGESRGKDCSECVGRLKEKQEKRAAKLVAMENRRKKLEEKQKSKEPPKEKPKEEPKPEEKQKPKEPPKEKPKEEPKLEEK